MTAELWYDQRTLILADVTGSDGAYDVRGVRIFAISMGEREDVTDDFTPDLINYFKGWARDRMNEQEQDGEA